MTHQFGTATLSKRYRIGGPEKIVKAHEGPLVGPPRTRRSERLSLTCDLFRSVFMERSLLVVFVSAKKRPPETEGRSSKFG